MKTVSSALAAHLEQDTTTLATCWKVVRTDGVVYRFTDHDEDIVSEGETFKASTGFARTAIETQAGYQVDNLDIDAIFDSDDISEVDMRAGKFDYAECLVFAVNWMDTSMGRIILRRGWLGEVTLTQRGMFSAELRGLTEPLNRTFGDVYTPLCRAELGDAQCKVNTLKGPRLPRTGYSEGDQILYLDEFGDFLEVREATNDGVTEDILPAPSPLGVDGSLNTDPSTFSDWFMMGRVTAVASNRQFTVELQHPSSVTDPTIYSVGVAHFASGDNLHHVVEVKKVDNVVAGPPQKFDVHLFLRAPSNVVIGDAIVIVAACDKRRSTCADQFDNIVNFRGEPDVPGQDAILKYPDAK